MLIVPLALLGIFLLLVSAFGNFRDAVIVMINVPFAAIGGVIALHLAGETLSISAFFGFLSLFGIAIQDGVILISFINKTAATEHRAMKDAMVEGASLRVRPVLMTAALSGLGLLPAALSHSIGSEAQRPLALVIVGGYSDDNYFDPLGITSNIWVVQRSSVDPDGKGLRLYKKQ
nr:efflux RND transporter permease subunit [Polynucleobacter necessarius]